MVTVKQIVDDHFAGKAWLYAEHFGVHPNQVYRWIADGTCIHNGEYYRKSATKHKLRNCPDCYGTNFECHTCIGVGLIAQERRS